MKKKALSFLMVITLFLSLIPVTASATDKSYLSLTPQYGPNEKFLAPIEAPIEGSAPISTRAELEAIENDLDGVYHLTADIDLAGAEWVPLGERKGGNDEGFTGTLDGQGYVISNLTITGDGYEATGLFAYSSTGIIRNLGMENVNIDISSSFINGIELGSICGSANWRSTINNCYSSGTVSVDSPKGGSVGGIIGTAFGTIGNTYNTATVSAVSSESGVYAGGIGGVGGGGSDINNCYNAGKISATASDSSTAMVGGICGLSTSISDCFNSGEVTANSKNTAVGGISGLSGGAGSGINNCYNTGSVSASAASGDKSDSFSRVGGICGDVGGTHVSGCFNTGAVSASNTAFAYVGGICGNTVAIFVLSKCYNAGTVSASATDAVAVGGIGGRMHMANISDCYNTGTTTASGAASIEAGGISGYMTGLIYNSYNIGQISAAAANDRNLGGLCGSGEDWNGNAPTRYSYCLNFYGSSFGTLLTSEQMKSADSFVGFDFTNIWDISPSINNGYPYLRDNAGDDSNHIYNIIVTAGADGTTTGGGTYARGENVTLTATPDSGYLFVGWFEAGEKVWFADAVYKFSADKLRILEARFRPACNITVTAGAGGTATGGGTYAQGEDVTLTATPDSGYVFDGWYEAGEKIPYAEARYNFAVTTSSELEARFLPAYNISITAWAGGTATGGGKYAQGENVTLTATPDSGLFDGWYEAGVKIPDAGAIYKFSADKHRTLVARFFLFHTITVTAGAGGTVTGGGTYNQNEVVTLTAVPDSGYVFSGWFEAGKQIPFAEAVYKIAVRTSTELEARFRPGCKITVTAGAGGFATDGGIYNRDEIVTLTAMPHFGYVFSGWFEAGVKIPDAEAVYKFSADKHRTLEARFLPAYTINVTAGIGGTATGGSTYKRGEKVTLTAKPDSGYVFDGWYEDGEKIPYAEAVYEFVATNLRTIEARFLPACSITVTAGAGGTATGGGTYKPGENVTLTAKPDSGYVFSGWYEDGKIIPETGAVYEFSASNHRTIEARFLPTYSITLTAGAGGTATGGGTYKRGEKVTLTAKPDSGYVFDGWYEDGKIIPEIGVVYEFPAIKLRTIEARFINIWKNPYSDVPADAWFYKGVEYSHINGLMKGTLETTFEPYVTLSRAMLATVLYRMEGEPKVTYSNVLSDVPNGQWYSASIIWASENGIVNGYGNGLFGTNDDITREQLATMIYRYARYKKYDLSPSADLSGYTDAGEISSWALDGVRWCVAEKLVTGMPDATLAPGGTSNRAQCATILMRFMENVALS